MREFYVFECSGFIFLHFYGMDGGGMRGLSDMTLTTL